MTMPASLRIYGLLAAASLLMAFVWQGFSLPADKPQSFPIHFYQHMLNHLNGQNYPSYPIYSIYTQQTINEFELLFDS
ncbi:MAG: hypothetical protein R8L58_05975, partial [Mariprofundaceae bacterium]